MKTHHLIDLALIVVAVLSVGSPLTAPRLQVRLQQAPCTAPRAADRADRADTALPQTGRRPAAEATGSPAPGQSRPGTGCRGQDHGRCPGSRDAGPRHRGPGPIGGEYPRAGCHGGHAGDHRGPDQGRRAAGLTEARLAAAEEVEDLLRRLFAPRPGLRELPAPAAHGDSARQHRAAAGVLPRDRRVGRRQQVPFHDRDERADHELPGQPQRRRGGGIRAPRARRSHSDRRPAQHGQHRATGPRAAGAAVLPVESPQPRSAGRAGEPNRADRRRHRTHLAAGHVLRRSGRALFLPRTERVRPLPAARPGRTGVLLARPRPARTGAHAIRVLRRIRRRQPWRRERDTHPELHPEAGRGLALRLRCCCRKARISSWSRWTRPIGFMPGMPRGPTRD